MQSKLYTACIMISQLTLNNIFKLTLDQKYQPNEVVNMTLIMKSSVKVQLITFKVILRILRTKKVRHFESVHFLEFKTLEKTSG